MALPPQKHSSLHVALNRGEFAHVAPNLIAIYFSALLRSAFQSTSGVLLHSGSSGKLFNLFRIRAPYSKIRRVFIHELLLLLSELFKPLLGRTRSRGRCWASSRLSHRPEPSDHAVHGKVDGLDDGGQHDRRFVLLRHTHKPQRRPHPICTSRSGNVRHRWGGD